MIRTMNISCEIKSILLMSSSTVTALARQYVLPMQRYWRATGFSVSRTLNYWSTATKLILSLIYIGVIKLINKSCISFGKDHVRTMHGGKARKCSGCLLQIFPSSQLSLIWIVVDWCMKSGIQCTSVPKQMLFWTYDMHILPLSFLNIYQ